MKAKDKKAQLINFISQQTQPVSLNELAKEIGTDVSERTLRRWLALMVEEGLIIKTGNKRATKYLPASHQKEENPPSYRFSKESERILQLIRRPIYERTPVAYADQWIEEYKPNQTYYIPAGSRELLEQLGQRARQEDPAGTYAHQIYHRLLIDLSYNSSRLEGNTYSLTDTKKLLLEGETAEGKLDEEKIMILNHKEAIRFLVDNAFRITVSKQTICTIHYLLSDGLVEPRYAGKIRDYGVRIGGSTYIPYEDKTLLQKHFERLIEKASLIKNPFEQSFFLLTHISYLQAFVDVNKRTARLSANIPLIKSNLVPLSFIDVDKEEYTSAIMAIYEYQRPEPLLDLYLHSYKRTCNLYDTTVKALGYDEIRVRYRAQRRQVIRHIILSLLHGIPQTEYIENESKKLIPEKDRLAFTEDVLQDLKEIDASRLAGLGVTPDQLKEWAASLKISP